MQIQSRFPQNFLSAMTLVGFGKRLCILLQDFKELYKYCIIIIIIIISEKSSPMCSG